MDRRSALKNVALAVLALGLGASEAWAAEPVTTIYLVRHAEKQVGADAPKDPALTEAGQARAQALARLLSDVPVAGVYSTDTLRTRTTGQPTAEAHGAKVQLYDHADPGALAKTVTAAGGSWLVVGHSNTVPGLVEAFGGTEPEPISDDEYDRLYQLVVGPEGLISQVRLRYGAPSTK